MPAPDDAPTLTGRRFLRVSFVLHTVFFVLRFTYMWLDDVVNDDAGTFLRRLVEEGTGSYGAFALSGLVFLAWRRWPLLADAFWRRIAGYVALGIGLGAINTSWMWASRSVLFPVLGLGAYDYGRMPLRYLMELPAELIGYSTMLAVFALVEETRARRARDRRAAELERALVTSQLQTLRGQLQPHFLFNALNTIAARVHDDPQLADALIGQLAALLRATLRSHNVAEVPLAEELALLDAYAALLRARFGARLSLEVRVSEGLHDVPVPPLLLQPLVENAVRHGALERTGRAQIRVTVARDTGERMTLDVWDDGRDAESPAVLAPGTGLSTTAQRLTLLHGTRASFEAGRVADGFRALATLPIPARLAVPTP